MQVQNNFALKLTPHSRENLQFQQTNRAGGKEPETHKTYTHKQNRKPKESRLTWLWPLFLLPFLQLDAEEIPLPFLSQPLSFFCSFREKFIREYQSQLLLLIYRGLVVRACAQEMDGMIVTLCNTCFLGNPVSVVMQGAVDVLVLFAPLCAQCGWALPVHAPNNRGRQSVSWLTVAQRGRSICWTKKVYLKMAACKVEKTQQKPKCSLTLGSRHRTAPARSLLVLVLWGARLDTARGARIALCMVVLHVVVKQRCLAEGLQAACNLAFEGVMVQLNRQDRGWLIFDDSVHWG